MPKTLALSVIFLICTLAVFAGGGDSTAVSRYSKANLKDSAFIEKEIAAIKSRLLRNPDSVYLDALTLLEAAKKLQYRKGVGDLNTILAAIWGFRGYYDKSTEHYSKALEIYEKAGDSSGIARAYMGMGNAFMAQENYEKAAEIYKSSLDLALKTGKPHAILANYITLINCNLKIGNLQSAIKLTNEAEKYLSKLPQGDVYSDLFAVCKAEVLAKSGKYGEALAILNRVEARAIKNEQKSLIMETALQKGTVFLEINDFNQAYFYLKKFEDLTYELRSKYATNLALKMLMQYFEKKNDFPNAYKYAVKYANAQDSLRKSISLATALQFETNFEFERKIREMEKLKSENVTKTSELERVATSNVALMSLVFLFVVVVVITTYINVRSYGSLRKIQKQNQKINQQKHALEIYSMQLEKANQDIALQKELLEERNRNILLMNDNLENIVANRTRDLAKKNEQITQYAYVNAHKLRAPVATIKGLVKVFKLVESPAEKELIISKISESSENLDKIIHEIQDIIGEKYDDDNFVIKS